MEHDLAVVYLAHSSNLDSPHRTHTKFIAKLV
jgi:hypothetical protein